MLKNGFDTKIIYPIPPHKQLAYKEFKNKKFPLTEKIHSQNLCLPLEAHFGKKDIKIITNLINKF